MRNLKYLNRKQILELMLNFAKENENLENEVVALKNEVVALQNQIKEQQLIIEVIYPKINYKSRMTSRKSALGITTLGEK